MSAKKNKLVLSFFFITLALLACNLSAAVPVATEPPVATEAAIVFTATPTSTPIPDAAIQACDPIVTTNTEANVRKGPGTVYAIVGLIPLGGTAPVAGKSFDGTWWYIQFPGGDGGYAWIAGSVTTATCIPATSPVIAAPPPPVVVPSNTPKPGAPDPTDVPPSGPLPPVLSDPPIYIFTMPSATPIPFEMPVMPEIPCFFC